MYCFLIEDISDKDRCYKNQENVFHWNNITLVLLIVLSVAFPGCFIYLVN